MTAIADNNWSVLGDERDEVARRAGKLDITGTPGRASQNLGSIVLGNGAIVNAHVVHAVDAVITDGTNVVLINRLNPPGRGKPALPGGFMDPVKAGVESPVQAAAREALEEVGIELGEGRPVGRRNMNRPQDVRVAKIDLPDYGIKQGDIFMVSTQAVRFDVPDLKQTRLVAGDDATPGSARWMPIASLRREDMGIVDHFDMIQTAVPEVRAAAKAVPSAPRMKSGMGC